MTRLGKAISGFMACSCLALAGPVYAATLVVEDDAGHIGLVNTSNGAVSNVHSLTTSGVPGVANGTSVTLTDLAYTSSGALYGNSFNYLYSLSLDRLQRNGDLGRPHRHLQYAIKRARWQQHRWSFGRVQFINHHLQC